VLAQRVATVAKRAEVDDALHPSVGRGSGEVVGLAQFALGPVPSLTDGVDQVDGGIDAGHGLGEVVVNRALNDLHFSEPLRGVKFRRRSGQAAHLETPIEKSWHESATDVAGGTGQQYLAWIHHGRVMGEYPSGTWPMDADRSDWAPGLGPLVRSAEESATAEITDPSKDRSDKAIVVTSRLGVKVSKAPLLEEQGCSAHVDVVGERRVTVPCLAYLLINTRDGVEVTVSAVGVVGECELIDLGPPAGVGTRNLN
jgi:hypothetical protein